MTQTPDPNPIPISTMAVLFAMRNSVNENLCVFDAVAFLNELIKQGYEVKKIGTEDDSNAVD